MAHRHSSAKVISTMQMPHYHYSHQQIVQSTTLVVQVEQLFPCVCLCVQRITFKPNFDLDIWHAVPP